MEHEILLAKYIKLTGEKYKDDRLDLDSTTFEYKIALEQLKDKIDMLEKNKSKNDRFSKLKKWTR